ncbi:PH domain-containing protein [Gangjinia marincola]|uniref:PH domain-containing protein n=1 Tax=Gangjinia marincola TaxID=578463 RepID=A0ABN1MD47_9FLAO
MKKKYPSKISYPLLIIIVLGFLAIIVPNAINTKVEFQQIVLLGIVIIVFALILHMFLSTYYLIENEYLRIKCGVFSYKPISIHEIKEISKTNSFMSAPAPSFDRIEITYRKFDSILISPKDKLGFAQQLKEINQDIRINI